MRLHHWRNAGLSSLMPSPITAVRRPPIAMRRRLVSMWRAPYSELLRATRPPVAENGGLMRNAVGTTSAG